MKRRLRVPLNEYYVSLTMRLDKHFACSWGERFRATTEEGALRLALRRAENERRLSKRKVEITAITRYF